MDPSAAREQMVEQQIAARGIAEARVLAAMRAVPRHRFVPAAHQDQAYADRPLPIGRPSPSRTSSPS
jgi:protein-L-isoaspartate(D-aspartate) O-methyltransferase